ncbi:hypothetical protein CAPTEDRAFT_191299 [Capitella teleta]|uniref:BZIP domain-containing protein n=1 Tax=Capitella teleta TaxID=283909 RepID=R7U7D0_CAPTE|nr:hypothetical protein CAPTEDRAFT_191299 [Capitella teleta]|eukprot:ELU01874.1 hypothetical protein CAPTEDRAFT_191299 [Capitella teleta]
MKVTLQESLSRAGIPPDQYAQLQQQQVPSQQLPNSTSEAAAADMGRVPYLQPTLGDNYPSIEQFFGSPDPDGDADDADPSQDEYEAFMRMLTGLEIPPSAQMAYGQTNIDISSGYPSSGVPYPQRIPDTTSPPQEEIKQPSHVQDPVILSPPLAVETPTAGYSKDRTSQEAHNSHMEMINMSSDSDSINSQPKARKPATRRSKSDKHHESPSPDTSTVRPVKTRPVDVDGVLERNRKNAIQARLNRQRKKEYIESMEDSLQSLRTKNEELESDNKRLRSENTELLEELNYVKNVLANQSKLAGLLKNIGHTEPAVLSSAFSSRKRKNDDANDERPRKVGGGLCVHVESDKVSIEMCTKCSQMAQGATQRELNMDSNST